MPDANDPNLPADPPVAPAEPETLDPSAAATMPNQSTDPGRPIPPRQPDAAPAPRVTKVHS